jgi:hypothetical protein
VGEREGEGGGGEEDEERERAGAERHEATLAIHRRLVK